MTSSDDGDAAEEPAVDPLATIKSLTSEIYGLRSRTRELLAQARGLDLLREPHATNINAAIEQGDPQRLVEELSELITSLTFNFSQAKLLAQGNGDMQERLDFGTDCDKLVREWFEFRDFILTIRPFLAPSLVGSTPN